jgi:hypothetical protein
MIFGLLGGMRLAFVTSLIPVGRADTGFEIANRAIVDALRASGCEVTCIGFVRKGTSAQPDLSNRLDPSNIVIDAIDIENSTASASLKLRWIAAALALRLPVACAKLRLAGDGKWVEAIRARGPFDAIVLNSIMGVGAFPELLDLAPALLVEHNVEFESARQSAAHSTGILTRLLYRREARLLEVIERRVCAKARFTWFLAEEDRKALGFDGSHKAAVLPLVPAKEAHESEGDAKTAPLYDIGLIGTWTWEPNRIGLSWFIEHVVPLIPDDIRIAIAGRLPEGFTAPQQQVSLLGRVADASLFLDQCRTIALTSRAGTGVQLKTIEAFGRGKPAVATSSSLRGFADFPANVIRQDDPAAFAAALATLVAQVHSGTLPKVDGNHFIMAQHRRMRDVVAEGLSCISGS